jgi:hypothetical protein
MDRIRTGKTSLFSACFGPGIAGNRTVSRLFGTFAWITSEVGLIGKSHFGDGRKSLILKGKGIVSDKNDYVNYS